MSRSPYIGEGSVGVIATEGVRPEVIDLEIQVSVVVAGRHAQAELRIAHAGDLGHVGELSVIPGCRTAARSPMKQRRLRIASGFVIDRQGLMGLGVAGVELQHGRQPLGAVVGRAEL